jgi:hypothetical protein
MRAGFGAATLTVALRSWRVDWRDQGDGAIEGQLAKEAMPLA